MRRISDDERRARLSRRHHLALKDKVTDLVGLAGDLVGLHGSDPASVFLAAASRSRKPDGTVAALERARRCHRGRSGKRDRVGAAR